MQREWLAHKQRAVRWDIFSYVILDLIRFIRLVNIYYSVNIYLIKCLINLVWFRIHSERLSSYPLWTKDVLVVKIVLAWEIAKQELSEKDSLTCLGELHTGRNIMYVRWIWTLAETGVLLPAAKLRGPLPSLTILSLVDSGIKNCLG
jgi:hypothetical protein